MSNFEVGSVVYLAGQEERTGDDVPFTVSGIDIGLETIDVLYFDGCGVLRAFLAIPIACCFMQDEEDDEDAEPKFGTGSEAWRDE